MSTDSADITASGAGPSAVDELIQRCPDATLCADQRGHIIFWNPAAEALFGISSEQAIGQPLDIIVPQPMRGAHDAGMKRILSGGSPRIVGNIVEVIAQHAVTGHQFPVEMSLSMWSHGDERRFGAVVRDVSVRRRNEDRLHQLAHFDQLTLLPNRTLLLNRLETALAEPDKVGLALLMIDLDGFKEINDCYGHATGDAALKAFAVRLHREMTDRIALSHSVERDAVTLSRFGGDEFAVLLTGIGDADRVCALADDVRKAVADPILIDGRPLTLTASIGVALAPLHGTTSAELLANADLALYRAKSAGRSRTTVFEPLMRLAVVKQRANEADLRRGWKANEFELFFQPQVDLADRSIIGAEALLRWRHPDKGLLGPGAFLAVLERMDLSKLVGDWVLAEACRMAATWRRFLPELQVGVNLFSSQIQDAALHQTVLSALKASKLPAEALELEITETSVLYEDSVWVKRLKRLRAAGVGLAFDDYGTGYASLSLLKRYPVSRLKIDRSFVIERGNESGNVSIIKAIVSFGHTFGVDVIAEGIESVRQHEFLLGLGCRQGQGYLYGRPMPAGAFTELLSNRIACAS